MRQTLPFARQALAATVALAATGAQAQIDLSTYVRTGVFNLPSATTGVNLLANEASAVTYNWDRDSLFVVGDGGTAIVEVSKTGALIGSMQLSGFTNTAVGDPEGIAYVGNGQFVLSLERIRQAALITYSAGGTATLAATPKITMGPPGAGNNGNEGIAFDGGSNFVVVKQASPQQVFSTTLDFNALTSSNGNGSTEPTNLFNPAVFNTSNLADVYALSTLPGTLTGADSNNLLVLSLTGNRVWEVSRAGAILSQLALDGTSAAGNEGLAMDFAGNLYVVNEEGGGSVSVPQLWVYAPIPEPGTWALFAAGLAALVWRRKRG
jgi:uncharacterized protein YjiK